MNYQLIGANLDDFDRLKDYKLTTVLAYANNLSKLEYERIYNYVNETVKNNLSEYKLIMLDNKKIGCILVINHDDGVLLDEIFIEEEYRNLGIGTQIITQVINENNIVYLYVYKENIKAYELYLKLGFIVDEETDSRYFMKYIK